MGFSNALENVVIGLGDAEDRGLGIRNSPAMWLAMQPSLYVAANLHPYHEQSTPDRSKYLSRAWRMRATPPPRGVALKNAMLLLRSLTNFA